MKYTESKEEKPESRRASIPSFDLEFCDEEEFDEEIGEQPNDHIKIQDH